MFLPLIDCLAATNPTPKIHFTLVNRTEGHILLLLVLQSEDVVLHNFRHAEYSGRFCAGNDSKRRTEQHIQILPKTIIQTDQRTFDMGPLFNGSRSSAFSLELNPKGVEISRNCYCKIMKRLRLLLVVFLFTYLIKGLPLLLVTGRYFKYFYKDFLLLNVIFAICFLISLNMPFGGNFDKSFERSNMFAIIVSSLL